MAELSRMFIQNDQQRFEKPPTPLPNLEFFGVQHLDKKECQALWSCLLSQVRGKNPIQVNKDLVS